MVIGFDLMWAWFCTMIFMFAFERTNYMDILLYIAFVFSIGLTPHKIDCPKGYEVNMLKQCVSVSSAAGK